MIMTRRLMLFLPLAACLRADSEKEVVDVVHSAIGGLSAGRAGAFLDAFDPKMPGYEKLRESVAALVDEGDLSCSVEVLSNTGDDQIRTLTLDWILEIAYKNDHPGWARRQKTVTCKFEKSGKKWRIVSFDPLDLFTP